MGMIAMAVHNRLAAANQHVLNEINCSANL